MFATLGRDASDPCARAVVDLLSSHLSATTYRSYTAKVSKFVSFCSAQRLQPFPASTHVLYLYLGFLSVEGRVAPENWKQYVAAINTVHRDMLLDPPGSDDVVTALIHAARLRHSVEQAHKERRPLHAAHVMQLLHLGVEHGHRDVLLARQVLLVVLAFSSFCRGRSVLSLLAEDVRLVGSGDELELWVGDEKTRKVDGVKRRISVNLRYLPELRTLWNLFVAAREAAWAAVLPGARLASVGCWDLPGDCVFRVDGYLNVCVKAVFDRLQLSAESLCYSGHSCRSGGASAAHALGVSLLVILSRGGWASSSDTVRKYVDVSVQPDAAVFKFFASLLPPHAVEPACSRLLGL
jgi:hypothetical protein